jgi:WXG100 family type VII secretion target
MPVIGAEIEQLQSLKTCFDTQASNVNELTSAVRNQLAGTAWQGPAADRFRNAWSGEFEPMLKKLSTALVESGMEVSRRREALIQAGS